VDAQAFPKERHLFQKTRSKPFLAGDGAVIGFLFARENFQQGRFTRLPGACEKQNGIFASHFKQFGSKMTWYHECVFAAKIFLLLDKSAI